MSVNEPSILATLRVVDELIAEAAQCRSQRDDYRAERDNTLALLHSTNSLNAKLAREHSQSFAALEECRDRLIDANEHIANLEEANRSLRQRITLLEASRESWRAVTDK